MKGFYYSIIDEDGQSIFSTMRDDGVLDIHIPQDCQLKDLLKYLKSMDKDDICKLARMHRKHQVKFYEIVNEMINNYIEEYNLPVARIGLRLLTRSSKILNYGINVYSWMTEGFISIPSDLQYYPLELVDIIVRCGVACIAVEYESSKKNVNECKAVVEPIPNKEDVRIKYVPITEDEKYRFAFEAGKVDEIISDFNEASKQITRERQMHPIRMAKVILTPMGVEVTI